MSHTYCNSLPSLSICCVSSTDPPARPTRQLDRPVSSTGASARPARLVRSGVTIVPFPVSRHCASLRTIPRRSMCRSRTQPVSLPCAEAALTFTRLPSYCPSPRNQTTCPASRRPYSPARLAIYIHATRARAQYTPSYFPGRIWCASPAFTSFMSQLPM